MNATVAAFLGQLESIDTSVATRTGAYESLIALLLDADRSVDVNHAAAVTALEGAPQRILQVLRTDIRSHEVGIVLGALTMLSWLVSGQFGPSMPIDHYANVFECVAHHLSGSHYNCVLLSLFVVANNRARLLRGRTAAEICSLCLNVILVQHRRDCICNTTNITSNSDTSYVQHEQKILVWAYKALVNAWQQCDSPQAIPLSSALLLTTFKAILTSLRARPSLLDFTDDGTADAVLVLAQIKLLLKVPLAKGRVCLLHSAVSSCKEMASIICGALKKAAVSEDTVFRYCQVWSLWLEISSELLIPANFDEAAGPPLANNEKCPSYENSSDAREAFWNLLAPKNGVGELTTPLQYILKRSRLQAAYCYKSIADALVVAKAWHEPPAVLKLLLRCLFHLVFSSTPVTALPTKSSTTEAGGISEQQPSSVPLEAEIENESRNIRAIQVAGEALCILCANVQRPHIDQVLQISVSMGRPAATPQAKSAAKLPPVVTSPRAVPGVVDTELTSAMATPTAKPPLQTTERASLDVIIRKLLFCPNPKELLGEETGATGNDELIRAAAVLVALQSITTSINATAALLTAPAAAIAAGDAHHWHSGGATHSTPIGDSSVISHAGNQQEHVGRPRSYSRSVGFSKGLFASPAKTYVKVPRRGDDHGSTGWQKATPDVVSCESIVGHLQLLMSAMASAAHAKELADTALSANRVFATLLEKSSVRLEHNMQHLCHAWQSCTVALAQALFDQLVASAETTRAGDDNLHETASHAAKYHSTQLEAFSLLFSAPTQASQLFYASAKRSPSRFTIPSQSSQPLYVRLRQQQQESSAHFQYQQQQLEVAASGRDGGNLPPDCVPMEPASQLVLCSAHPPAVQATVELCSLVIKAWREIWMGTTAGRREHKARGIFIESFWWFLHRTTGFNVDANTTDFDTLCEAVQETQPFLSTEHCPDNMTGMILLMTLSHACLSTNSPANDSYESLPTAPAYASTNIIHRALFQCMNSMTESGVLPPLFTWIPFILARLQSVRGQQNDTSVSVANDVNSTGVIAIRCDTVEDRTSGLGNGNACVLILASFLQRSLQQLSSMTVPTASEQHSPALMHSMIGGLRHLLTAPLIICIGFGRGVSALLEEHSTLSPVTTAQTDSLVPSVHLLEAGNKVIANWRSIMSLWLELKEFAMHHYAEGDLDAAQASDPRIAWVDGILATNHTKVHIVPFVADTTSPTSPKCAVQGLQELYATLCLIRAGVDSSVQHRRKHPQSKLTSSLALTLLSLLVSSSGVLKGLFSASGDSASAVQLVAVNNTKAIDSIVAKYLTLFPPLLTHVTDMLDECPRFCIGSTTAGPSEIIFSHLLQVIAALYEVASSRGAGSALMIHVKQWALSMLSSLCAVNTAVNNAIRGFRSVAARLTAGVSMRQVVKNFVAALAQPVDAELQEIISAAWRELGGVEAELTAFFSVGEPAVSSTPTANPLASPLLSGAKLAPAKDAPSTGLKRSFIPSVVPAVLALNITSAKVPRHDVTTSVQTPASSGGFLKVTVPALELAALAQKANAGLNARQGFVPATYTVADRANLDQQSQQGSQLHSQLASQAPSQHQPDLESEPAAQRIPSQTVWPQMSPPKPQLSYTTARTRVSQHSDSTTYVSPTPGTHSAHPVSQQRRQAVPPCLPMSLPMELCAEDIGAEGRAEEREQVGQKGEEGKVAGNVTEQVFGVIEVPPTARAVLQELVAATADGVVSGASTNRIAHREDNPLSTVLQDAYSRINRAVDELSGHLHQPAAPQGPTVDVDTELLGAAIRQSHRLTGLLLEVLSQLPASTTNK